MQEKIGSKLQSWKYFVHEQMHLNIYFNWDVVQGSNMVRACLNIMTNCYQKTNCIVK